MVIFFVSFPVIKPNGAIMKINKKFIVIFFAVIIIAVVIISLMPGNKENDKPDNKAAEVNYEKLNDVIFPVKVSKAIRGDLVKYVAANGTIKAFDEVDIISNISGTVNDINIYNGKLVNKNDTLICLDNREYQIAIDEAKNKIVEAQINYGFLQKETPNEELNNNGNKEVIDSLKKLIAINEKKFHDRTIKEDEYIKRQNDLDLKLVFTGAKRNEVMLNKSGLASAINQLNRAKLNLEYTLVIAPFNGVIADFNLSRGQRINAGEKLFKLLDILKFKVNVGVLENEIINLRAGNIAEVTINAIPDKTFPGKILFINPIVDPSTKTCQVTIEIINKDNDIKPGMFATVKIQSRIERDKILVLKDALLVRDQRNLVFIANGNLAKWHYVDIGESNDKYIEIKNGVQPGDSVIVQGNYNLAHDAKINVIE